MRFATAIGRSPLLRRTPGGPMLRSRVTCPSLLTLGRTRLKFAGCWDVHTLVCGQALGHGAGAGHRGTVPPELQGVPTTAEICILQRSTGPGPNEGANRLRSA